MEPEVVSHGSRPCSTRARACSCWEPCPPRPRAPAVLLRASSETVSGRCSGALRRARTARHGRSQGVSARARHRAVGRARVLRDRRRVDASISRAVPNDLRLIADAARIEAVFTHRCEGGLPLSPPVCGHAARRGARVAALHQSGERPHAPRRPRGGLPPAQGGHHGAVRSRKGEVMKTRPGACRRLTAVSA